MLQPVTSLDKRRVITTTGKVKTMAIVKLLPQQQKGSVKATMKQGKDGLWTLAISVGDNKVFSLEVEQAGELLSLASQIMNACQDEAETRYTATEQSTGNDATNGTEQAALPVATENTPAQ